MNFSISRPSRVCCGFLFGRAVALACCLISISVPAEVITFEDRLPDGIFPISAPYHKLSWNNLYAYEITWETVLSGYPASVHSGTIFTYNGGGADAVISSGLFNLNA